MSCCCTSGRRLPATAKLMDASAGTCVRTSGTTWTYEPSGPGRLESHGLELLDEVRDGFRLARRARRAPFELVG